MRTRSRGAGVPEASATYLDFISPLPVEVIEQERRFAGVHDGVQLSSGAVHHATRRHRGRLAIHRISLMPSVTSMISSSGCWWGDVVSSPASANGRPSWR